MAIGVALYTLFGGLVLQRLEEKPVNLTSVKGIAKRSEPIENSQSSQKQEEHLGQIKVNEHQLGEIHRCVQEKLKVRKFIS